MLLCSTISVLVQDASAVNNLWNWWQLTAEENFGN